MNNTEIANKVMTCPYCHQPLERIDVFDSEYAPYYIKDFVSGECPRCGKEFQWEVSYVYNGHSNFHEISE